MLLIAVGGDEATEMTDEREHGLHESTIEMQLEPRRLVEAGAQIVRSLRVGCTPGDILDVLANAVDIPPDEFRRSVLGVLDGVGPGDLG